MASVTWAVRHKSSINIETYMVALDYAPTINLGLIRFLTISLLDYGGHRANIRVNFREDNQY